MTQPNPDAPLNATRASSDADSEPSTITEQIKFFLQREHVDRGYGISQPSLHRGNIEPLDQLLGPAGKKAKKAKGVKRD
jgi:hypothetical protein